jgi:FAD/FMN-containing dehydrogenase
LESAFTEGLIVDAAIAQSEQDCLDFWCLRDDVEQTFRWGEPIIFDVSLPTSTMEAYTQTVRADIEAQLPGARVWIFGHLGDGNLHLCVQTQAGDAVKHRQTIERCVYEPLQSIGGSVSAEHGIGLEKKPYLHLCRSETEIAVMRALKAALDPKCLLNPGKIF